MHFYLVAKVQIYRDEPNSDPEVNQLKRYSTYM